MISEPDGTRDDLFLSVAGAISCEIGEALLVRVVEVLRRDMNAALVMITRGEGDPATHARAVYALRDGAPASVVYALKETPCALVYSEGRALTVPCDLARQFPREAGFESYVGVPLLDGDGRVVGHFAAFSRQALVAVPRVEALMRVLAGRIEAEMRRADFDAQRTRLMDDLRRSEAQVREQNAYKTRLLGLIAHDLRNPLAAIIAQAELAQTLAGAGKTERVPGICDKIIANAERLSNLMTATLERVREEDADLILSRSPCDIGAVLALAVSANAPDAARKGIALDMATTGRVMASADAQLLLRAVDNLVSNAVKYTQPGGQVRVSLEAQPGVLRIAVADNGQGLDEEDKARAFGRFVKLSARPTGGESSTGLGLANAREIVEAHGGRLSVESPGKGMGATFTIDLPREGADNSSM